MSEHTALTLPEFHLVTPPHIPPRRLVEVIQVAAVAGATVVQLRIKDSTLAEQLQITRMVVDVVGDAVPIVVNGALEAARVSGISGLHLPDHDNRLGQARLLLGPRVLLGASVHSVASAQKAAAQGVDYLIFGNVFPTQTHPGSPGRGIAALSEVVTAVTVPVIAIGGIAVEQVGDVIAAGAAGIAVVSAIFATTNPGLATRRLAEALQASWHALQRPAPR
ncbi:MAG: thiamine phosphate synthase [Chloroflexi bacterium]|nr:thiamine phosphate synthase [Chloroflexota bacterium]